VVLGEIHAAGDSTKATSGIDPAGTTAYENRTKLGGSAISAVLYGSVAKYGGQSLVDCGLQLRHPRIANPCSSGIKFLKLPNPPLETLNVEALLVHSVERPLRVG
jgi:hypothetical protein